MNEYLCGLGGMILTGDNRSSLKRTCPSATFFHHKCGNEWGLCFSLRDSLRS